MTTSMALMLRAIIHALFPISEENGQKHRWIHDVADGVLFIPMAIMLSAGIVALTTYLVLCGLLARNWEDLK